MLLGGTPGDKRAAGGNVTETFSRHDGRVRRELGGVVPSAIATRTRAAAPATMLAATVIATVDNNVVNVPLPAIARELAVPASDAVLAVSVFVLALAAAIPVAGWAGDRFGRRRVLCAALSVMALGSAGAALAPDFAVLVGCRAVQGLACAAVPSTVMAGLTAAFPPGRRARAMGAWAAANGLGQAAGPPLGGVVSEMVGWRGVFWLLAVATALVLAGTRFLLPPGQAKEASLHWPGAVSLTTGAALVMAAAVSARQSPSPWLTAGAGVAGLTFLVCFVLVSRTAARPLVPPRLLAEPRFLRSSAAVFAQMFCLGAVLVAVPLQVSGVLGHSTLVTGLLVFVLPATMAVAAPLAGRLSERGSPRRTLRLGLVTLACAVSVLGACLWAGGRDLAVIAAVLAVTGGGVALVQTPSAAGATRSPAGRAGAALGVFNLVRFAGSAFGAAWVAAVYPQGTWPVLFGGCALVAVAGLALTFVGPDPALTPE
jgi:MFS family permease